MGWVQYSMLFITEMKVLKMHSVYYKRFQMNLHVVNLYSRRYLLDIFAASNFHEIQPHEPTS